jgi:hypothetical protein
MQENATATPPLKFEAVEKFFADVPSLRLRPEPFSTGLDLQGRTVWHFRLFNS